MHNPNAIWICRIKSLMMEVIPIELLENDLVMWLLLILMRTLMLIHIPSLIRHAELFVNLSRFLNEALKKWVIFVHFYLLIRGASSRLKDTSIAFPTSISSFELCMQSTD